MGDLLSLKKDTKYFQLLLKAGGFYTGRADGIEGPLTEAAEKAFLKEADTIKKEEGEADERSESNIITLLPAGQRAARQFLSRCKKHNKEVRIISGTRSYKEQNRLFSQGRRGNTLPKVTNARGGQSNHNFGIAFDIGIFSEGKYITAEKEYRDLAALLLPEMSGLEWGGSWKRFPDLPHYQLETVSDKLSVIQTLFQNGKPYLR